MCRVCIKKLVALVCSTEVRTVPLHENSKATSTAGIEPDSLVRVADYSWPLVASSVLSSTSSTSSSSFAAHRAISSPSLSGNTPFSPAVSALKRKTTSFAGVDGSFVNSIPPNSFSFDFRRATSLDNIREFFVSPNKQFLNWKKVYKAFLIILMIHFLHTKHSYHRYQTALETPGVTFSDAGHLTTDPTIPAPEPIITAQGAPDPNETPPTDDDTHHLNKNDVVTTIATTPPHNSAVDMASEASHEQRQCFEHDSTLPHCRTCHGLWCQCPNMEHTISDDSTNLEILIYQLEENFFVLRSVANDLIMLHYYAISWTTLKTLVVTLILHAVISRFDEKIQSNFYDRKSHKNINQLPPYVNTIAKKGLKWVRNICIVLAVWPWESEFGREVNLLFVEGSMWMSLVKRGLKMIADRRRIPAARRPPNENFARGIYYGGFPSGHLSQAGYAIALYRLAYNVDFLSSAVLILLLIHTIIVTLWVVTSNRHYLSQVVGGLALGIIYAVAATQVIAFEHLAHNTSCPAPSIMVS